MGQGNVVLEHRCDEPEGSVVRTVKRADLSLLKLREIYDRCSGFDVIFNDFVRNDIHEFVQIFLRQGDDGSIYPNGIVYEVDDVGILYLTNIRPTCALAHFTFWDRRIRGREGLIREMLKYAFEEFGFHRIEAEVALYSNAAMRAVERIGFTKEGRKRKATRYKGEWFDLNFYSMLEHEV